MANVTVKAIITRAADGSLFHREENEWGGISDATAAALKAELEGFAKQAQKEPRGSADLTAVLSGSVNGVPVEPITMSLDYKAHFKLEKDWNQLRTKLAHHHETGAGKK